MISAPLHHPHRRFNPLTGEWVLVSPHRTERPWLGRVESGPSDQRPAYDPKCYLCPGNTRAGGKINPKYESTFVFTNDFSALLPESPEIESPNGHPLFRSEPQSGTCRVVCFSPRHDLTLAEMPPDQIQGVIQTLARETSMLGETYDWVQVFENKGDLMGCSNPHPHGQIWASADLPQTAFRENNRQGEYYQSHGRPLLLDYQEAETASGERIVLINDHFAVVVPFWAVWPFETLLIPRNPAARLADLPGEKTAALAEILKRLLVKYDNLFETEFPYSMGWHQAPFDGEVTDHFQVHAHFFPPLLRSATVRKFMVGYEMLAEPQRDLTPESAAQRLRELSEIHYKAKSPGSHVG